MKLLKKCLKLLGCYILMLLVGCLIFVLIVNGQMTNILQDVCRSFGGKLEKEGDMYVCRIIPTHERLEECMGKIKEYAQIIADLIYRERLSNEAVFERLESIYTTVDRDSIMKDIRYVRSHPEIFQKMAG